MKRDPIKYVDALIKYYGEQGFPPYKWTINDEAPLTKPAKPLNKCRATLLTSGGVSQCAMPGFDPMARNDHRLDAIPVGVDAQDFQIHDAYYNHEDAERDINCIFPIDTLRQLAKEGRVGSVADRFWSGFMGRIYDRTRVIEESAPAFVAELKKDEVDLLIAVPA